MSKDIQPQLANVTALRQRACLSLTLFLLLSVAMLCVLPICDAADLDEGMPTQFRTGFMKNIFSNTDPRDASAVLEMHSREIARHLGLDITASVSMFSDIDTMIDAIRKSRLELVAMPSLDYLHNRKRVTLFPSFVGSNIASQGIHFVVITRKDSGIRSFSDLKGKTLLLPAFSIYEPSHLWLEVLLMKTGNEGRDTFFAKVNELPKISKAIMGVFFRQADAAIVTRASLDTSRQLNPQLETQLVVLAESPNLCDIVVCMLPNTSKKFRRDLNKAMITLSNSASGRQMYTIFQSGGMSVFKQEYMDGLEELVNEHARLLAKKSKRN